MGRVLKADFLIVGAGLYGSVFAHEATKLGKSCIVVETRNHIGGNCYTKEMHGTQVHMYGPHIFHTNDKRIWDYINQFAEFNNFVYRPKIVAADDRLYPFPINLMTMYMLFGCRTPAEAQSFLNRLPIPANCDNLEDFAIGCVGERMYSLFIEKYTAKQWNCDPASLPASIIKRIPVRTSFDDNYFNDRYQGIPIGGYTQIFEKLLDGIEVHLSTSYSPSMESTVKNVIFTGPIDQYFNYKLGRLEYRSLRFSHDLKQTKDFQGNAVINYANDRPYTRVIEHKHFDLQSCVNPTQTVVTTETPMDWEPGRNRYYPVPTEKNNALYREYKELSREHPNVRFCGRLGSYRYMDMHQVIAAALKDVEKVCNGS